MQKILEIISSFGMNNNDHIENLKADIAKQEAKLNLLKRELEYQVQLKKECEEAIKVLGGLK